MISFNIFSGYVHLKTKYNLTSIDAFEYKNKKIYNKVLNFYINTKKINNFLQRNLRFITHDYAYTDMDTKLLNYDICGINIKYTEYEIFLSYSLYDSILAIWLAKDIFTWLPTDNLLFLIINDTNVSTWGNLDILNYSLNSNSNTISIQGTNLKSYCGLITYPVFNDLYNTYYLDQILNDSKYHSKFIL